VVSQVDRTPAVRGARRGWLVGALAAAVTLLFLAPFAYLVLEAFGTGFRFVEILTSEQIREPLANSLLLATSTSAACVVLGTVLAVLVQRTDLPGAGLLRVLLPLPLAVPSFVAATALVASTGPGGLVPAVPRPYGFWGAFWVLTLLSYPYVYLPVLGRLARTGSSGEEASRLLGRGPAQTVRRVLLPQLRPAALGGGLLVFLYVLSDFGAVALLRYDTITRVLYAARLLDTELALTLGLLLGVLAIGAAVLARRASGSVPVQASRDRAARHVYRLRGLRWPALAVVVAPLVAGLVVPLVVFVIWVVRGSSTVGVGYSGIGDDLGFLVEPIVGSTVAAVSAAAVAMLVVLPVAVLSVRRPSRWATAATAIVSSVFALPGIVVALAIVAWAVSAPEFLSSLYQSFPLLILGYVLHFGAQSMRSSQAALGAVPARLGESAAVLGAGPRRRFRTIDLPLILPGLLAGGGLVLLSTMKELPATLLLAPIGFETLATTIWNASEDGFYAEVGVASIVLVALSAVLTWVLVLRPARGER